MNIWEKLTRFLGSSRQTNIPVEQVQEILERMHQDERFSSHLNDELASILLRWGENELQRISAEALDVQQFERQARELLERMRMINLASKQWKPENRRIELLVMLENFSPGTTRKK